MPIAIEQMGLAGPGRAERDDVGALVQEVELAEVLDHLLFHAALEGEVELLQRFAGGEAGLADARLAAVALPRGGLGREQRLREPLIAPFLLAGAFGELRQRAGGGGRLEQPEQVCELGVGAHGWCSRNEVAAVDAQPPGRAAAVGLDQHPPAQPSQRACRHVLAAAGELGDPRDSPDVRRVDRPQHPRVQRAQQHDTGRRLRGRQRRGEVDLETIVVHGAHAPISAS